MERQLTKDSSGVYFANNKPLRFVHFSGFDSGTFRWAFKSWGTEQNQALGEELAAQYEERLASHSSINAKKIPWSYSVYKDGLKIKKTTRSYFSNNFGHFSQINPFAQPKAIKNPNGLKTKVSSIKTRVRNKIGRVLRSI